MRTCSHARAFGIACGCNGVCSTRPWWCPCISSFAPLSLHDAQSSCLKGWQTPKRLITSTHCNQPTKHLKHARQHHVRCKEAMNRRASRQMRGTGNACRRPEASPGTLHANQTPRIHRYTSTSTKPTFCSRASTRTTACSKLQAQSTKNTPR